MADETTDLVRHETDVVSLVAGLLLLVLGGLYLLHDTTDVDVDGLGPVALVLVGLVGLGASLRRR